jgi:DNA-binding FadR family transcriptional regulator
MLFSCMVGELRDDLKSGCLVANSIEEELIRRPSWPADTIYGSEAELCNRFKVGHAVIREAVRVLEVRGVARMRRGPNGGLQVLRPSRIQSVETAADYFFFLGLNADLIGRTRALLDDVKLRIARAERDAAGRELLQQIERIALPLFDELIEVAGRIAISGDAAYSGSNTRPSFHRSRAGQIARRLMTECSPQEWMRGMRLGSTFDLCERFQIDRGVLRQAIRILESAGMATSVTGRGHGVISQAPTPASVCRLISCYFAANGMSADASMELFHAISVEAIRRVTEVATDENVAQIFNALDKLENAGPGRIDDALFQIEESQYSILQNPLVDLLIRSTKAFPSWYLADNKALY